MGDVAHAPAVTCAPRDDVHQAMGKMKTHRVRRLPVVDQDGALVGIVSMNDLVLAVAPESPLGGKVVDTLPAAIARMQIGAVIRNFDARRIARHGLVRNIQIDPGAHLMHAPCGTRPRRG